MQKNAIHNPYPPKHFCPMCPDHYDETMRYSDVLDTFVCVDCYDRIGEVLTVQEGNVNCDFHHHREELERISGKNYPELRRTFNMQRCMEGDMIAAIYLMNEDHGK